jgi:hypothetical protein
LAISFGLFLWLRNSPQAHPRTEFEYPVDFRKQLMLILLLVKVEPKFLLNLYENPWGAACNKALQTFSPQRLVPRHYSVL